MTRKRRKSKKTGVKKPAYKSIPPMGPDALENPSHFKAWAGGFAWRLLGVLAIALVVAAIVGIINLICMVPDKILAVAFGILLVGLLLFCAAYVIVGFFSCVIWLFTGTWFFPRFMLGAR